MFLFDPVQQPTAWPMAAMIGRWKRRFCGVFPLEHSGRMRHADQEHCVFARVSCGLVEGAPGMLLKHVVDVLQTRHVALTNTIRSLIQPANRRPERNAVVT